MNAEITALKKQTVKSGAFIEPMSAYDNGWNDAMDAVLERLAASRPAPAPSMPEPSPARAGYPYTEAGDLVMADDIPALVAELLACVAHTEHIAERPGRVLVSDSVTKCAARAAAALSRLFREKEVLDRAGAYQAVELRKATEEVARLSREVARAQESDAESLAMYYRARDRAEELSREVAERDAEIAVDNELLADRQRILDACPCPVHGPCVPHVLNRLAALTTAERERDDARAAMAALLRGLSHLPDGA